MDLTIEQEKNLQAEVNPMIQGANELVVRTPDQSLAAQELLKAIKGRVKKVEVFFAEMKETAHKHWKSICAKESMFLDPLDEAERIIKRKVVTFQQEIERKQREEAAKIEAKRQEEERVRKEELQRQAEAAAAKGKAEKAEALRAKAEEYVAPPVFVPPVQAQASGTAFKKVWAAEVTDLPTLLKSIAEGRVPLGLVAINESALQAYARGVKGTMVVPGLKFFEKTIMAVRTK